MKKYEIMYVIRDGQSEENRKAEVAKIHAVLTSNGATIINVNEWGSRDLAYIIKEQRKGYYVVVKVTASAEAVKEFDRLAKINNAMLRHLIIVDPEQK